MKTMTFNTNGLENEGFRELTADEMTDVHGGAPALHEIPVEKKTDQSSPMLLSAL